MERNRLKSEVTLWQGDCLDLMKNIPDRSIDLILCDLPYGTIAAKWDVIIPFDKLWAEYLRVIKPKGAIVLTSTQPFTTKLIASNFAWFKYTWVWDKVQPSGFQIVKFRPMQRHEDICVFGKGRITYVPKMSILPKPLVRANANNNKSESSPLRYSDGAVRTYTHLYPQSIIRFSKDSRKVHSTQKPVALMEYLIKTYSRERELVMDNCMGGGSTGIAAIRTGRNFIGIEKDEAIFKTAERRIRTAERTGIVVGRATPATGFFRDDKD